MTARGTERIASAFAHARGEDRAALIVYLTGSYPDREASRQCFAAAVDGGADILEIGFPFSDPMMDGPIIQAANQHVLDAGTTVADQFDLVRSISDLPVPKVVMTYVTIADTYGYERFAADAASAGVDGVILPDLPVSEAAAWRRAAADHDLATIFLASSVSTDARLEEIGSASSGWVYATGLLGVTGVHAVVDEQARVLVERVRRVTDQPVAVGIGVRDEESAARVAAYADGVIVGSALVDTITRHDPALAPAAVGRLVARLRAGCAAEVPTGGG